MVGTVAREASPKTVGFTGTSRHASKSNPASLACQYNTSVLEEDEEGEDYSRRQNEGYKGYEETVQGKPSRR
jgi:hypothetical protein